MVIECISQPRVGVYVPLDPFLKGGRRCPTYVTYCAYNVYIIVCCVDTYQRRAHWIECNKGEKELGEGLLYSVYHLKSVRRVGNGSTQGMTLYSC